MAIEDATPAQRFDAMIAGVTASAQDVDSLGGAVDWEHGALEMAAFYTPLQTQNQLLVEWIHGRLSSLLNAVMLAAVPSRRDSWQESGLEMLFGRMIADLQAVGYLVNKGYFPQAYSAVRMTFECCDLADLFWIEPQAAEQWFGTTKAYRDFGRRSVRDRIRSAGMRIEDDAMIYGVLCERSHPRWRGLLHTLIEPHKLSDELSNVDAGAFRWDAGYWSTWVLRRMALRLRYVEAAIETNPAVSEMLTNLDVTFAVLQEFQRSRVEALTSPEEFDAYCIWYDRLRDWLDRDDVLVTQQAGTFEPR